MIMTSVVNAHGHGICADIRDGLPYGKDIFREDPKLSYMYFWVELPALHLDLHSMASTTMELLSFSEKIDHILFAFQSLGISWNKPITNTLTKKKTFGKYWFSD